MKKIIKIILLVIGVIVCFYSCFFVGDWGLNGTLFIFATSFLIEMIIVFIMISFLVIIFQIGNE